MAMMYIFFNFIMNTLLYVVHFPDLYVICSM